MEAGVERIKLALKVLREYYTKEDISHEAADRPECAGSSIVGLLEVAESEFTSGLSEIFAQEDVAAAELDRHMKEKTIEKTTKDQDAKYKTKEPKSLGQAFAELTSDR